MKTIDEPIRDVLRQVTVNNNIATMPQLDRSTYVQVNKVLESLGGKWNRKLKGHSFDGADGAQKIADAVMFGTYECPKDDFDFFETPEGLAGQMVQAAEMIRDHYVLEPSAGRGQIVKAITHEFPGKRVDCCELSADNRKVLEQVDGVLMRANDFLLFVTGVPIYDRIIANPPFSKGRDVEHVSWMWRHLKEGGRIVTITGPGWTFREDRKFKEFREWIKSIDAEWEELPEGTFKESGTNVRTVMLIINKKG